MDVLSKAMSLVENGLLSDVAYAQVKSAYIMAYQLKIADELTILSDSSFMSCAQLLWDGQEGATAVTSSSGSCVNLHGEVLTEILGTEVFSRLSIPLDSAKQVAIDPAPIPKDDSLVELPESFSNIIDEPSEVPSGLPQLASDGPKSFPKVTQQYIVTSGQPTATPDATETESAAIPTHSPFERRSVVDRFRQPLAGSQPTFLPGQDDDSDGWSDDDETDAQPSQPLDQKQLFENTIGNLREAAEVMVNDDAAKMAKLRRQEYGALEDGTVGRF